MNVTIKRKGRITKRIGYVNHRYRTERLCVVHVPPYSNADAGHIKVKNIYGDQIQVTITRRVRISYNNKGGKK